MPRRACRKDTNHNEIKGIFEAAYWAWIDTWQFAQYKPGFPDGIAAKRGEVIFVEIKNGNKPLTTDEVKWHREWGNKVEIVVIHSGKEAMDFVEERE